VPTPTLRDLLRELDRAHAYTEDLRDGLTPDQIAWRPGPESSGIGWHLGHQRGPSRSTTLCGAPIV
jgi:hypothetical protein